MDSQGSRLTESLPALLAFERFFLGVDVSGKQKAAHVVMSTDLLAGVSCCSHGTLLKLKSPHVKQRPHSFKNSSVRLMNVAQSERVDFVFIV